MEDHRDAKSPRPAIGAGRAEMPLARPRPTGTPTAPPSRSRDGNHTGATERSMRIAGGRGDAGSVSVNIPDLIVRGLPPASRERMLRALETELHRQLASDVGVLANARASPMEYPGAGPDAGVHRIRGGLSPEETGVEIARGILRRLRGG